MGTDSLFTFQGGGCLLTAMLKRGVMLVWLLLVHLVSAAPEATVLPEGEEPPAVDKITPVPLPDVRFGAHDLRQPTLPKELKIDNQGVVEGSVETGVHLAGPVKIDGDNGLQVFSNTAELDLKEKSVIMEGNVSVYQGNILQRGRRAVYYYERKFLDSRDLSISMDPIIMEAGKFTVEDHDGKQVFTGKDAGITTHDVEHPNFWLRATKTRVFSGDKIVFNNLWLYAGDIPVFWLPYLSQPLKADLGYHAIPGSRSSWGPYLLNTYGIMLGGKLNLATGEKEDAWLLSKWHLDARYSRGLGTGVSLSDIRNKENKNLTGLSLYYLHDSKPETPDSGMPRGHVDPDRYRIELKHRQPLKFENEATWHVDANLTLLSDAYYLQDFWPALYRSDPQPDNTLGIFRRNETSLLSLYARGQINDFQRTATRLPELAYDQAKGPLFGTPVLHEGTTSLGILMSQSGKIAIDEVIDPLLALPRGDSREAALLAQLPAYERLTVQHIRSMPPGDPRIAGLKEQLQNSGYTRLHTYQDFSLPFMVGNWLSLTPQVGIGYTRYMDVDGPLGSEDRTHVHAGMEAAVKFSKDLGDFKDHGLGLDGLLHIMQPYTAWSVLSTNELDPLYTRVDRLTLSTRPRTFSPARFTAIDDMEDWNIVRLGLRNRLLTRRDGQSHEWLYLNTYMDAFIDDPELNRRFSNLCNDFRFAPTPWLSLGVESQFPIIDNGSGFDEFSTNIRYLPTSDMSFALGYRWLQNHPVLLDSNHVDLRAFYRINENWGMGMQQSWELDDGTLELQQYTLHRDLGNWVAGIGLSRRDDRLKQQYGVVFTLTLKDFPSMSMPLQIDAN